MIEILKKWLVLGIVLLMAFSVYTIRIPMNVSATPISHGGLFNSSEVKITLEVSRTDLLGYEWYLDFDTANKSYISGSIVNLELDNLSDGKHVLCVRANFGSDVWSDWSVVIFFVDTTSPEAPEIIVSPWWMNDNTPLIAWTPDDLQGVDCYYWFIDDGPEVWTDWSSATIPPQLDGIHYFNVYTIDKAGNVGPVATKQFKIDTTAPPAPDFHSSLNFWNSEHYLTFKWTRPVDASGVTNYHWKLDGGDWNEMDSAPSMGYETLDLPFLSDGSHTFLIKSEDIAGNIGLPDYYNFVVDTTAPEITKAPDDGISDWSEETVRTLTWSGKDSNSGIAGYYYKLNFGGEEYFTTEDTVTLPPLADSAYFFFVRPVDKAGNLGSWRSHLLGINAVPTPTPFPDDYICSWSNDNTPEFTWDITTENDIIAYYWNVDGGTWQEVTGDYVTLPIQSDGEHTLSMIALDKWNILSDIGTHDFYIDTTAPTGPTIVYQTNGYTESDVWQNSVSDPYFYWNDATDDSGGKNPVPTSGIHGYYLYWGTNPKETSYLFTEKSYFDPPAVPPGEYYLKIKTIDNAGNVNNWETRYIFKYEDIGPVNPTIAKEKSGSQSGVWQNHQNQPSFSWNGGTDKNSGVKGYYVYIGSDPEGTSNDFTEKPSYDSNELGEGVHYLRINTVDNAGNFAGWITLFQFKYYKHLEIVLQEVINDMKELYVPYYGKEVIGKANGLIEDALLYISDGKTDKTLDSLAKAIDYLLEGQKYGVDTQFIIDKLISLIDDIVSSAVDYAINKIGLNDKYVQNAKENYDAALTALKEGNYVKVLESYLVAYENAVKAVT